MLQILAQETKKDIKKSQKVLNKIKSYLEENNDVEDITDISDGELFYFLISKYSTQKKAVLAQTFIANKLGAKEIAASENQGDFVFENTKTYVELKHSFKNQAQNLNIRQIRLWQNVDYYYCFYVDEDNFDNSNFYILTKEQMKQEVELCGGATHGTIEANINNQNIEYSITIPQRPGTKSEKTKRWEQYKSEEIKRIILNNI